MSYPIIMNGDHAEFERDFADTPPHERPDWPLPSFDARDWATAFCARNPSISEDIALTWFANALMRGFDEHAARVGAKTETRVRWGFKSRTQLPLFMVWREYVEAGEVVHAVVLFNTRDWIGA